MKVYSNGHELIAIANLFRIRIHIFTFTDAHGNWNIIHPDPEFKTSVELPTNWAQQCVHYDLLVSDNSRLAEIDPHPHSRVLEVQPLDVDVVKHVKEWQKVTSKKKTSKIDATNDETRLISIESQPKKVVVVVFVVVGLVVVVGVVVLIIVGHRNLTLKFDQNWVTNKSYIAVVVVVVIILVLLLLLIQKPSIKTWSKSGH